MSLLTLQFALLFIVTFLAIRYAGIPERAVSSVFLAVLVIDQAAHLVVSDRLSSFDVATWHLILEVLLTGSVIYIALRADRFWTLFVASAQTIALLVQLLRFAGFDTQNLVGAIMIRTPTWLAIVLTGIAIVRRLPAPRTQQQD